MMRLFKILSIVIAGLFLASPNVAAQTTAPTPTASIVQTMADVPLSNLIMKQCPAIPIFIFNYANPNDRKKFLDDNNKPNQDAFSHSIVFCADTFIKITSIPFIMKFSALVSGVAASILVLAIVVFSFKVFMGQANIRSLSFVFIMKVIIVFTVIGGNPVEAAMSGFRLLKIKDTLVSAPRHFGGIIIDSIYKDNAPIDSATKAFGTAVDLIMNVPPFTSIFGTRSLKIPPFNIGGMVIDIPDVPITIDAPDFVSSGAPFQLLDKNIYSVLDLKKIKNTFDDTKTMQIGAAQVLVGLLFSGEFGAMLSVVIIIYAMVMVVATAQAILFFVTAHLILTVLMALAPVVMPCMLFERTSHITKKWFMALISYTLQPLVFMAFFAFTILILDKVSDPIRTGNDVNGIDKFYSNAWKKLTDQCTQAAGGAPCKPGKTLKLSIETFTSMFGLSAINDPLNQVKTKPAQKAEDNAETKKMNGTDGLTSEKTVSKQTAVFKQITINYKDTPEEIKAQKDNKQGVITPNDLKEATAYIIAIILLMVILISFMQMIPSIVEEMIGKVAPGAFAMVEELTKPLQQISGLAESAGAANSEKMNAERRQNQQQEEARRTK